jgi:Alcohol dehydrogenase, class IV
MDLVKFLAPEFVFGIGARKLAGRYLKNLGARCALVVSDEGLEKLGWVADVVATLDEAKVPHVLFLDVHANPRDEDCEKGARLYKDSGCDAILSIGGGSPTDCAKGIGILTANPSPLRSYEGIDRIPSPGPPLVCVPTTSGASADVSQFAIIRDMESSRKMAIVSRMLVPDIALIDPEITSTMGPELTAATGIDALVHSIEAYVSNASSPITDIHALEAMRIIPAALPSAVYSPLDLEARSLMSRASMEAGLAFSNAILGAVHAMAHAVGGLCDSPHGECNAVLLPEVVRTNFPSASRKYREAAKAIGIPGLSGEADDGGRIADALRGVMAALPCAKHLSQFGVSRDDFPGLIDLALADPCMLTNPRPLTREEVSAIYERCL